MVQHYSSGNPTHNMVQNMLIMRISLVPLLCILNNAFLVAAQFGNIFEMFGQTQDQQHHGPTKGHSPTMWSSQADVVGCNEYLCPSTLVCVDNPSDCPCPSPQDIKCIVQDSQIKGTGTVVCMSGTNGCKSLDRFRSI